MTPERWQQVKDLLQDAPALPSTERVSFLTKIGDDDPGLAREVDSLLAAYEEAGAFIVTPALARVDAVALVERLQNTWPAEQRSLGISLHTAGEAMILVGDLTGALDCFRREAAIFEVLLASNPTSPNAQRNVAVAYKKVGAVLETQGDMAAAVDNCRKAIALDERRAHANANDTSALLDLSFGYASIGYTLASTGDTARSLENYAQALALRERVAGADPNDVQARPGACITSIAPRTKESGVTATGSRARKASAPPSPISGLPRVRGRR